MRTKSRSIFVFITGFLALGITAIVAVNVSNSRQRRAATQTLWALFAIHDRLEAYGAKHGSYPECESAPCLAASLFPGEGRSFQGLDGWNRPLQVDVRPASYLVYSGGRDGKRDAAWRGAMGGGSIGEVVIGPEEHGPDDDIVLSNGDLPQYPWGTLAGWDSPPWGVDACQQSNHDCGVLYVTVSFAHWPAPLVRLRREGDLIAELWKPGPMTFRAPVGEYSLGVYWPDDAHASLTSVSVKADTVKAIALVAPPDRR